MSVMETMREYVVRRAFEHKRYRQVADENEVGYEWLCKLARNAIRAPGSDRIEKLHRYYRSLESNGKKRRGRA
jgi:hypothetical protein